MTRDVTLELCDLLRGFVPDENRCDPESIAKALGIRVLWADLDGRAGGLTWGASTATVELSRSDSLERQRFTLAHELTHFVVGSESLLASRGLVIGDLDESDEERLCDRTAAELLMPRRETNASGDLTIEQIREFARERRVSLTAAAARLIEVGRHNAVFAKVEKIGTFWEFTSLIGLGPSDTSVEVPPSLAWSLANLPERQTRGRIELIVNGKTEAYVAEIERVAKWAALLIDGLRWRTACRAAELHHRRR